MKIICRVVALVVVTLCMPALLMAAGHGDYGCTPCHTPHHAVSGIGVPLWSGKTTTTVFTLYSSSTLNAAVGQPDGASKLCLSCHDGTDPNYTAFLTGSSADFGNDLSTTHPISFVYTQSIANGDTELYDPSHSDGHGGTIASNYLDSAGKVQCISCHDIHSSGVGTYLLRGYDFTHAFNGGALCRVCHIK